MPSHVVPVAAILAALAAVPSSALAAQVATDRFCYLDKRQVTLSGNGFTPGQAYQVTLDGQPLASGNGTVDASGNVSGSFAPNLATQGVRTGEHTYTLSVQEGANVARTRFTVTRFLADFKPTSGNPRTLRVRFAVFGFGLVGPRPDVYVHYVRPGGKLRKTVRIGRAGGACGSIIRTRKRRLFPFRAVHGSWNLQFDTSKRYRRGTSKSSFLFYTLGVRVRRASR